jgi:type VI secretion system protein ImpH
MAGPLRDEIDSLTALPDDETDFSFFQLIALLERRFRDAPAVGAATEAGRERIRFRALPSLAFPPADIAAVASHGGAGGADGLVAVTVTFLGLFGPASPLPTYYTEDLLGDDPGQETVRDFLDLFNHRLISFVYKAWKKYRYYAQFRRGADDAFSGYLFALMGLPPAAPQASEIDRRRLLGHAGLLGLNCRSAGVIERVLAHYFEVPVRIEEAVERLLEIPASQCHRLGGRRTSLGVDWLLGERLPDRAGKFRIWIGPVTQAVFRSFLPDGANHKALIELVTLLLRDPLDYDVRVLLAPGEMEPWHLGGPPSPLGWFLWLGQANAAEQGVDIPLRPGADGAGA